MKYLIFLLAPFLISGCSSTQRTEGSKALNSSNLQKTNYGTYRLVASAEKNASKGLVVKPQEKAEEQQVSKGVPFNLSASAVKETDVKFLSPKQAQQEKESTLVKEAPNPKSISFLSPERVESVEGGKPSVLINWGDLFMFYLLAVCALALCYLVYQHYLKYKLEANPFKEKKKISNKKAVKKKTVKKKSSRHS